MVGQRVRRSQPVRLGAVVLVEIDGGEAVGWVVGVCRPNGGYLYDVRLAEPGGADKRRFRTTPEFNVAAARIKRIVGQYDGETQSSNPETIRPHAPGIGASEIHIDAALLSVRGGGAE